MTFLFLGTVALVIGLLALHGFTRANPSLLARQFRLAAGGLLLILAAASLARGLIGYAVPLGALGWYLLSPSFGLPGMRPKSSGQMSRVTTDHLEMELDHDTGEMRGRVLKGIFKGRDIEGMKPAEMALLWQDCRLVDVQSAQLIEAYLDRRYPSWREDVARGEQELSGGPDGRMSATEALDILGLKPGATEDDIRRAHRQLMLKMHPDRGGSTYLASKINEAKDVLLDSLSS
jgi:DnaJ-domain-containing protein 1